MASIPQVHSKIFFLFYAACMTVMLCFFGWSDFVNYHDHKWFVVGLRWAGIAHGLGMSAFFMRLCFRHLDIPD